MRTDIFPNILTFFTKRFGLWVFSLTAWIISTGYFLFFPGRVRISVRFYKVLFPIRSWLYHLWCAWRQYHNFTTIYIDRFRLRSLDDITYIPNGRENLEDGQKNKSGGTHPLS